MDSVASDWFWFWVALLVVVVVVVRALAVPSSLLVSWSWLTSLGHHNSLLIDLGTWFRCSVKIIGRGNGGSSDKESEYVKRTMNDYTWFQMGIFTLWDDEETCKVF